jgi:hypothetical protein
MKLQDDEREALSNSAVLLKFAAESPKTAPNDVILPLLAAWEAAEKDEWSPAIAAEFWIAYSKLCDLIKPVTMDTVRMGRKPAVAEETRWWLSWWNHSRSPAQTHARRYLVLLLILVICAVAFGFIAGTSGKLSDEIEKLVAAGDQLAPQISQQLTDIKPDLDALDTGTDALSLDLDDKRIPKETRKKIDDLRNKLQNLYRVCDQLNLKVYAISHVTSFAPLNNYHQGDLSRLPVLDNGFDNVTSYYKTRRDVAGAQQNVALLNAIYNALVPLLLGAVGAATYVLRLVSDQIKDSTFASSSPIRHVVRIALGSLAGLIIGLGGFNNELNLSSAALSFLAGYSIEPVFSTLDGIAEKFRRS